METPIEISDEILKASEVLGMSRESLELAITAGCLSADLADQIMVFFDTSDELPIEVQKAFAVLFRFSRTLKDPSLEPLN